MRQPLDNRPYSRYIGERIKSRSEGRRRQTLSRRMERVRFSSRGGPAALSEKPRWSAGRRSAPEAGGSRKRIVLWRAPRPKRERVVTFARVARPRLWRLPALHFPLPFGEEFFERGVVQTSDAQARRENGIACLLPVTLRWPRSGPRRATARAVHPSRLASLAPQDDGETRKRALFDNRILGDRHGLSSGPSRRRARSKRSISRNSSTKACAPRASAASPLAAVASVASPTAPEGCRSCVIQAKPAGR